MFIGNLGKDPEVSYTPNGLKVVKFSLAVNEKYKEKETTTWVNVVAFDKLGDITAQYCRKGQQIFVEGRLSIRNYNKQDGTPGTWVEVLANQVVFLEKRRDAEPQPSNDTGGSQPGSGFTDDDIPF
jgi:single-strand DNA-binding protein